MLRRTLFDCGMNLVISGELLKTFRQVIDEVSFLFQ